ncbi:PAS domain-containing sensor histidine kinase [Gracilimonas sp.]|uniref:PAS domain-containing sensor histidine kinase n=1 Tax=Gracilimonas sp. TaxID=1974203 RepID=UPI003BACC4AD
MKKNGGRKGVAGIPAKSVITTAEQFLPIMKAFINRECLWVNVPIRLSELLGKSRDKIIGRHFTEYFIESDRERIKENWNELINHTTHSFSIFTEMIGSGQEPIDVQLVCFYPGEFEKNGADIAAYIQDLTEQNRHTRLIESQVKEHIRFFELLSDGYLLVDSNGNIKEVNDAYCRMTGYSREEVLGMTIFDINPDLTAESQQELLDSLVKNRSQTMEVVHKSRFGKNLELLGTLVAIERSDGVYIAGIVKNVSEQNAIMRELSKQSIFNSKLLESTNDGYILADSKGNILDANPAYSRMVGFSREELRTMTIRELESNFSDEEIFEIISGVMEEGNAKFETSHLDRFGNDVILESNLTLIDEVEDEPLVVGFVRDITANKLLLNKIKESEERWGSLVRNNPHSVVLTKGEEIIFANNAVLQLYGTDNEKEIVGHFLLEFIHPDDREQVKSRLQNLNDGVDEPASELRFIRKNGEVRYLEIHSAQARFQGLTAVQSVLHDVTDRVKYKKSIEKSLKQKEVMLEEIHHRVKNNLAVVSGLMELKVMYTQNQELAKELTNSYQRIHTMARIHEVMYKNESLENLQFDELLKELVDMALVAHDAEHINVAYNLSPVNLTVNDAIPCALILNEVVSNSIRHGFEGIEEATLSINISQMKGQVLLEVSDNGKGIPRDILEEGSDSLGLTLMDMLTGQLSGDISIKSGEGQPGTTVELRFPSG